MGGLSAQSVAVLSYLDPIIAIVFSAFLLGEWPSALTFGGAILILGAAMVSEMPSRNQARK